MNRRSFFKTSAIAGLTSAAGIGGYTWRIEPHWLQVVERDLPIGGLPADLHGARMLQLSDIHVGPRVDASYLVRSFQRAAELRPELVAITGDFLTYDHPRGESQFDELRDVLAHVPRGRLGTFAVLGNHDYGRGWREPDVAQRVQDEAERAGIHVLRNEGAVTSGLEFIGVDDLWAKRASPLTALEKRSLEAAIVLCHNPDTLDLLPWGAYRGWILSGHTHGGQCKPPFLPAPLLPVQNTRYAAGEVVLEDGRLLYVNRGLGHLLRVRFNVRPEITHFTLRPAPESD